MHQPPRFGRFIARLFANALIALAALWVYCATAVCLMQALSAPVWVEAMFWPAAALQSLGVSLVAIWDAARGG